MCISVRTRKIHFFYFFFGEQKSVKIYSHVILSSRAVGHFYIHELFASYDGHITSILKHSVPIPHDYACLSIIDIEILGLIQAYLLYKHSIVENPLSVFLPPFLAQFFSEADLTIAWNDFF